MQNLAISSFGTSSAYIIGFFFTPFITRIYTPEAYGLFAIFNAFVLNLSQIANLNYTNAFLLPKTNKKFINLVQLTLFISTVFCICISVLFVFAGDFILKIFNAKQLGDYFLLVPLFVFFNSINTSWEYWNIRAKEFKRGAGAKISSVTSSKSLTLIYGLITNGYPAGLIIGEFITRPLNTFFLTSKSIQANFKYLFSNISFNELWTIAKTYKDYPVFNMPSNWLLLLSTQFPIFVLTSYYSIDIAGYYSLSNSLLSIPTQMAGLAIAQVFFQRAIEISNDNDELKLNHVTIKLFKNIAVFSIVPFGIITLFGEQIFSLLAGDKWKMSGFIASILSVAIYFQFLGFPLSSIYRIKRKEKLQFKFNLINAFLIILILVIPTLFNYDFILLIVLFSAVMVIMQLVNLLLIFRILNIENYRLPISVLAAGIAVFGFLFLAKYKF